MTTQSTTNTPTDEKSTLEWDDTEVSSMSWVRIQELEYVRRICADVMKRMKAKQ